MWKILVNFEAKANPYFKAIITKAIETSLLKQSKVDRNLEVNIYFLSKVKSKKQNKLTRSISKPTDVISLPFNETNYESGNFLVGELLICLPIIKKQAKELGHKIERELSYAAIHGTLHCLGFDHKTKRDESLMVTVQAKLLNELGLNR